MEVIVRLYYGEFRHSCGIGAVTLGLFICIDIDAMYRKIFIPTDKIKCFFSKGNFFSTDL